MAEQIEHKPKDDRWRCHATCLVGDERWGAIERRCELFMGHETEHEAAMNACTPLARMVWENTDA